MREASPLLIPPLYTASSLTTPLPSLSFVRSCFHVLHAIPILSLLYRVPATMYYPLFFFNNFFLHTSYLLYLLPRRPQTQNSAPSCFWLWAHNGSKSNSLGSCTGGPIFGVLPLAPLIFLFGARGPCPLLTIFTPYRGVGSACWSRA